MAHSPAISVVIAAHNATHWLRRTITSLEAQTCKSYEILLVDNGSTDETNTLCNQLANENPRIRVLHQEHASTAAARNAACEIARGNFLYFMNGNDWCEPTLLSDMHRMCVDNELDLLIGGFTIDTLYNSEGSYYREIRKVPNYVFKSQHEFRINAQKLFDAHLFYAPGNMLYRRSYLEENGISYPDSPCSELPFKVEAIRNITNVGCIGSHAYHSLKTQDESENAPYDPDLYAQREEEHLWLSKLYADWGMIDSPEIQEFLARRYSERLVACIENVTNNSCELSSKEKRETIQQMISAPHAQAALKIARPNTTMMKLLLAPLRQGNVTLTVTEASFISWVRRNNTGMFARLKASR